VRRIATTLSLFLALAFAFGVPARASTDHNVCSFYAKIGRVAAEFMLPKTFGEVMAGVAGKNPELMAGLTDVLLRTVNGAEVVSISSLAKSDVEVLGKAAGQTVFKLLFSGQATTAQEAESQMLDACKALGYQTIISNQKAADQLTNQNLGLP